MAESEAAPAFLLLGVELETDKAAGGANRRTDGDGSSGAGANEVSKISVYTVRSKGFMPRSG